ncbi:hypothetical protein ACGFR8_31395 [Streptomyces brevispora]|uniref:hypothetical protein n=1 Tax=Streptomyces brevispora TaxID=887462 RepID=UPI0037132B6F
MTGVLTTDHPAWIEAESGGRARAVRTGTGLWALSWDRAGLHMQCVAGTEDTKPRIITTDPTCLPDTVPATLKAGLCALGPTQRLANPWLWDAISTAILRQVVQAAQARKLYRAWCAAYGTAVSSPHGELFVAPSPQDVLGLKDEAFKSIGATFHRTTLTAAAEHYLQHASQWQRLGARDLASALTGVPRIGPWTAAAAACDYTGDFSTYPHDDLAVRTWAAKISPSYPWPDKKDKAFGPMWTGLAGRDSTALHTLTLSTLTWGSHAR